MTTSLSLTMSDEAHKNFVALKNRLEMNQNDTISIVFEQLDVEKFARSVEK